MDNVQNCDSYKVSKIFVSVWTSDIKETDKLTGCIWLRMVTSGAAPKIVVKICRVP
jgi:hypothetical protein